METWLESNHKVQNDLSIIEQLAYISNRGMGAMEYFPSKEIPINSAINLNEIIEVLKSVLDLKSQLYL